MLDSGREPVGAERCAVHLAAGPCARRRPGRADHQVIRRILMSSLLTGFNWIVGHASRHSPPVSSSHLRKGRPTKKGAATAAPVSSLVSVRIAVPESRIPVARTGLIAKFAPGHKAALRYGLSIKTGHLLCQTELSPSGWSDQENGSGIPATGSPESPSCERRAEATQTKALPQSNRQRRPIAECSCDLTCRSPEAARWISGFDRSQNVDRVAGRAEGHRIVTRSGTP